MKKTIAIFLLFSSTFYFGKDQLRGYEFHQAFTEATLPPFYFEVIEDLGLSKEQQETIRKETDRLMRTFIDQWDWLRETGEVKSAVLEILSKQQSSRLSELKIQYDGVLYTMIRDSIQRRLSLDLIQKVKVNRLFSEFLKSERAIPETDGDGKYIFKEHDLKVFELKQAYGDKVLSLLNRGQVEKYKKLKGENIQPEPQYWKIPY